MNRVCYVHVNSYTHSYTDQDMSVYVYVFTDMSVYMCICVFTDVYLQMAIRCMHIQSTRNIAMGYIVMYMHNYYL